MKSGIIIVVRLDCKTIYSSAGFYRRIRCSATGVDIHTAATAHYRFRRTAPRCDTHVTATAHCRRQRSLTAVQRCGFIYNGIGNMKLRIVIIVRLNSETIYDPTGFHRRIGRTAAICDMHASAGVHRHGCCGSAGADSHASIYCYVGCSLPPAQRCGFIYNGIGNMKLGIVIIVRLNSETIYSSAGFYRR